MIYDVMVKYYKGKANAVTPNLQNIMKTYREK